jgi:hypothetical protein
MLQAFWGGFSTVSIDVTVFNFHHIYIYIYTYKTSLWLIRGFRGGGVIRSDVIRQGASDKSNTLKVNYSMQYR